MNSKVDIQGDVGVAIGENHAPITINYGGSSGGSGSGDEPPSGFVYFRDMTLDQLRHCKKLAEQALNQARKEIFCSFPAISMAIHAICVISILFNIVEFIGIIKQLQEYMILLPISFVATLHFLVKKVDQYAPLISEYKGEVAGVEKELLRRRISSR